MPRSRRAERPDRRAYPGRSAHRRVGWWTASAAGQRRRLAPRRPRRAAAGAPRRPPRARRRPRPTTRPQATTSPDAAELAAVADNLETTIATADPRQAKGLLRLLIKDLRINGRSEILPTYRVVTPAVCALPSSVGGAGLEPATSCL